ncbi:MAG: tetratricopeptide repeat protein [Nitrospinota bacterium]
MRILVVSNNDDERNLIREYISRLPYREHDKAHHIEIIENTSGDEAFILVKSQHRAMNFFDLIIVDQNMPGMTGLRLAYILTKNNLVLSTPIIIFCKDIKNDIPKEPQLSGITGYFEKPASYKKMMALMVRIAAIRIAVEERARKQKIESLMSKRGTLDFLTGLENIYLHSADEITKHMRYAPWSSLPYLSLARIFIGSNKFSEAIPYLKTAIKINYKNKEAHRNLLLCYRKTGKIFAEKEEIEEMVRVSPRSCSVLLKAGDAELREGDYKGAINYFKRAIANHRPSESKRMKARSHLGLGKAYMMEGDVSKDNSRYDIARGEFNKALTADPLLLAAYNNLAVAYRKFGMYEEAKQAIAKAVEITPQDAEGWFSLFEIYLVDGEMEKAGFCLQKALNYDPDDQILLITAGEIYMRVSMPGKAVEMFERAAEINPSYKIIFNYLGICYRRLNKIDDAIACYEKALDIDPEDHNIYYNLGKAYYVANSLDMARKAYKKALELEPEFKEAKQDITMLETYSVSPERQGIVK